MVFQNFKMNAQHGVKLVEEIDPLTRLSIACPALPMCGLAINEAERVMPTYVERMRALLDKLDLGSEEIMMRITGCPNGCARLRCRFQGRPKLLS